MRANVGTIDADGVVFVQLPLGNQLEPLPSLQFEKFVVLCVESACHRIVGGNSAQGFIRNLPSLPLDYEFAL